MAPYKGAKRYLRCLFIEFEAKEKARSQKAGTSKRKNGIGHPIHRLNSAPKNIIRRKTKM